MSVALTLELPAERTSPSVARRWIRPLVAERVLDSEALLLCLSEIVANAVLHAGTPCLVSIRWVDDVVRIGVRDTAPERVPVKRNFDRTATTGRGLRILDSCTYRWGVDHEPAAKTVWFELPVRHAERTGA